MRALATLALAAALFASTSAIAEPASQVRSSHHHRRTPAIPGDRWLEIDLYWFERGDVDGSVVRFWDRFAPLYAGVQGYRGVVLNVGWTVDYVMAFSGRMEQRVPLPSNRGQAAFVALNGPLPGDVATQKAAWKRRFANARQDPRGGYEAWTYADLRGLTDALRREGARRGIPQFKVASLVYAWNNAYGDETPFAKRHPEAWTRSPATKPQLPDLDTGAYFDPSNRFHADPTPLAAFPKGLSEGTSVHAAFAAQWGAVSRRAGLEGLMLRDSFGFVRAYTRDGPFGPLTPDPAFIRRTTQAVSDLVRETKQANPAALVMMYSSGSAATSDWRNSGLDLERIADEGFLDIFIDQTWAGEWGEVGQRESHFWNAPDQGWTYQLQYLLQHAAVLAKSKVRHYPLVETFDAWETPDVIHTVPDRLRWGIWAYSHAAVKTPMGLKVPGGSYISWAHQGKRLLSQADVAFLSTTINAAVRDAHTMRDVYGPTVVYARESARHEAEVAGADREIGQWTDEQVAALAKWPVPVLSITRLEWLPRIKSDLFIIGAPAHLPPAQLNTLTTLAKSSQPLALFGRAPEGLDAALLQLAGLTGVGATPPFARRPAQGRTGDAAAGLSVLGVPKEFAVRGPVTPATAAPGSTVYAVDRAPGLVLQRNGELNLSVWDPPLRLYEGDTPIVEQLGGSPAPFALAAATLTTQLAQGDHLRAIKIEMAQTAAVGAWRSGNGRVHILAGAMEEGLRDDADHGRHTTLILPRAWGKFTWRSIWRAKAAPDGGPMLRIDLPAEGSLLFEGVAP